MEMESEKFKDFVRDVNDLWKQYLSTDYPPTEQRSSLKLLEDKLKRRYLSSYIRGQKRQKHLFVALRIVMRDHGKERFDIKQRLSVKRKDANVPTVTAIMRIEQHPKKTAHQKRLKRAYHHPTQSPFWFRPNHHAAAAAAATPIPPAEAPAVIKQTDDSEIHVFLRTCEPPMTHHLRPFVDFGCATSPYLRSVSRWPAEQRYKLLKRILESGECDAGASPSEMDIAVLEHKFDTYFMED